MNKSFEQLVAEYREAVKTAEQGMREVEQVNGLLLQLGVEVQRDPFSYGKDLIHVLTRAVRYVAYVRMENNTRALQALLPDYDQVSVWSKGEVKIKEIERLYQKWEPSLKELMISPFKYACFYDRDWYNGKKELESQAQILETSFSEVLKMITIEVETVLISNDMSANLIHFEKLNSILFKALTT